VSCLNSKGPEEENAELMRKVAEGDTEALVHLYLRFAPALMSFLAERGADQDLCDELVQKIFVDLWAKRADFRAQSSFETYLFGIAKHILQKEMRRSRQISEKSRKSHPGYVGNTHKALSQPEAELHSEELREAIKKALGKITKEQRQALEAVNTSDISFCWSSEKSKCSHEAHKGRLKRARKKLWRLLAPILRDDYDSDKM